mgnify:CR=1 FL=1
MAPKEHNRLVGIFLMAHGGMQAAVMLMICIVYGIIGAAIFGGARGDEKFVGLFFIIAIVFVAIFTSVFAGSQILGGYKMFKERPNARTFGIVASIVSIMSFPLGTAAGVYGLWFLFGDEGRRFYLGAGQPQPMFQNRQPTFESAPPPPNSWQ